MITTHASHFVEECEEVESDGDAPITSDATKAFAQEDVSIDVR